DCALDSLPSCLDISERDHAVAYTALETAAMFSARRLVRNVRRCACPRASVYGSGIESAANSAGKLLRIKGFRQTNRKGIFVSRCHVGQITRDKNCLRARTVRPDPLGKVAAANIG